MSELKPRVFDPIRAAGYLERVRAEETQALIDVRLAGDGPVEVPYYVNRPRLGISVFGEVEKRYDQADHPITILMLGDGAGEGTKRLMYMLTSRYGDSWRNKVSLTTTSLQSFPSHQFLTEQRVDVRTGILAEQLTQYGLGTFDIVATDSVLGWTDMNYSIPEIKRSLNTKGVWIGLEAGEAEVPGDRRYLQRIIEDQLQRNGMLQGRRSRQIAQLYEIYYTHS